MTKYITPFSPTQDPVAKVLMRNLQECGFRFYYITYLYKNRYDVYIPFGGGSFSANADTDRLMAKCLLQIWVMRKTKKDIYNQILNTHSCHKKLA